MVQACELSFSLRPSRRANMEFIWKSIFPDCMSGYFDLLRFFLSLSLSFSIMWNSRLGSGFGAKHIVPQVRWRSLGMIAASAVLAFDLGFPFDEKRKFLNFHFEFQNCCFILLAHFWGAIFWGGAGRRETLAMQEHRVSKWLFYVPQSEWYIRLRDWWEQTFGR